MIKAPHYKNFEEFKEHASFANISNITVNAVLPEPNKYIEIIKRVFRI